MNCQKCGTEVVNIKWERDVDLLSDLRDASMTKYEPPRGSLRYIWLPCRHEYRGLLTVTIDAAGVETYEMTS